MSDSAYQDPKFQYIGDPLKNHREGIKFLQDDRDKWKALAGEMKVILFDLLIHHKDGCENANHLRVDEIFNDVDILLAKAREAGL